MERLKRWCSLSTKMKGMYWMLFFLSTIQVFAYHPDKEQIEKKKNINLSYTISPSDKISLNNQFGDIKVSFWDKKEVRVEVIIVANASSEGRAADFINTVDVTGKKEEGQVVIKTIIDRNESNYSNNNKGEKNSLKVDYQVYMPKSNALQLKNSFGNVYLPTFTMPLTINQSYGKLMAEDMLNTQSDVTLAFCKNSYIKSMAGGKLKASYSSIKMEKADDFDFNNSFGEIDIKEVGKIDAKISYSSGTIGLVKESSNLKLDFSGDFRVGTLGRNVKELDINANYSPVNIALDDNVTYDFDIKAHYGDFDYPEDRGVSFTRNTETVVKKDRYSFNPTKYYSGKLGKGSAGCKITINGNFSSVKLR